MLAILKPKQLTQHWQMLLNKLLHIKKYEGWVALMPSISFIPEFENKDH